MYILIIGAGKLGYKLSEVFSMKDNDVALVDINDEALQKANANIDLLSVKANGLNIEVLQQLNIHQADLLIAVTAFDETNMLIATLGKSLGAKRVVARIRDPEYANQTDFLKQSLHIDYVSNPDYETAKEIAKNILKSEAVYMEDFAKGKVSMTEFRITSASTLTDQCIKDINLPRRMLIVAIKRNEEMVIPNGDTMLHAEDLLYVVGVKDEIQNFSKMYDSHIIKPEKKRVKHVMILGGGKTAFYLAKRLIQSGVQVKIVERNKEKCKELAISLHDALIIHGDATDVSLLVEENVSQMDALVLLTGFDEENILLSMVAKKQNVPKIITKVSKPNYVNVIQELGIEMALNPILITASGLMRFAQGGKLQTLSLLLGGQAEVMEIIAIEGSKVVGHPLKTLDLPKGIIIGAIVKSGKVYIPDGNMHIEPNNRIIVFCLKEDVDKIETYFYKGKRGILNELWYGTKGNR